MISLYLEFKRTAKKELQLTGKKKGRKEKKTVQGAKSGCFVSPLNPEVHREFFLLQELGTVFFLCLDDKLRDKSVFRILKKTAKSRTAIN